jgi:hypothetical protein
MSLMAWSCLLGVAWSGSRTNDLSSRPLTRGPFLIPSECPIEPGREVAGALCEPSIVFEESARARISGTGMLWLQGLVPENILDPIASALSETVGSGSSPTALLAFIEAIAAQSGLKEVLQERRWIGTVDRFWRLKRLCSAYGGATD